MPREALDALAPLPPPYDFETGEILLRIDCAHLIVFYGGPIRLDEPIGVVVSGTVAGSMVIIVRALRNGTEKRLCTHH